MKLRVLWPGKTRKGYYKSAIDDYVGRIAKLIPFEVIETREESATDRSRARRIRRESETLMARKLSPAVVALDSSGREMTSEEFAAWLGRQNTDVDFIIGGPEGHQVGSSRPALLLSFGKLTLPHELARVVLLEQIYRALTILKRIPYHK